MAEDLKLAKIRWTKLEYLQEEYKSFLTFLEDVMIFLGFTAPSRIQQDIAEFLASPYKKIMIQAQRGQAKTTITACFVVWCLIHNPRLRCVIVSTGNKTSSQISTLITKIIMGFEPLECLRPDKNAGDRSSVEQFDVHHSLKGVDKSPSIACSGVSGSMTGWRADILIADDVEHPTNSNSANARDQLLEKTKEFSAICESGRIIYLGTPQSTDSIYNILPSRGYIVRIWPGRYPNQNQMAYYGEMLAPMLLEDIDRDPTLQQGGNFDGSYGKPTDDRINEEVLREKFLEYGEAGFLLQYMLNTSGMDLNRFPLKTEQLISMSFSDRVPLVIERNPDTSRNYHFNANNYAFKMASPLFDEKNFDLIKMKVMYIDPAGGGKNADETGFCVAGFLNGNIYVYAIGGLPGGYEASTMQKLADIAKKYKVNVVKIEKNMGYGAFKNVFAPILLATHTCAIEEEMVSGQKEKRIAEVLEPVLGRGSLVFHTDTVEQDTFYCSRHDPSKRLTYSLFYQMNRLTLAKDSLAHDDRLDALAGAVNHYIRGLSTNQIHEIIRRNVEQKRKWESDPLGHNRYKQPGPQRSNILNNYKRR